MMEREWDKKRLPQPRNGFSDAFMFVLVVCAIVTGGAFIVSLLST